MGNTSAICKLLIDDIRISVSETDDAAFSEAAARLRRARCFSAPHKLKMHKKSIDARRKNRITFVCSVYAEAECTAASLPDSLAELRIKRAVTEELVLPRGSETMDGRPVIIGFGPAGMFCAIILAECGFRPIVLERGGDLDSRIAAVARFSAGGSLDLNSNIQFGAGGAGTFSDGKLTTRIGDNLCAYVLERLHEFGAPEDILFRAKPHIGTDILRDVVRAADRYIRSLGGEIRYNTRAADIEDTFLSADGEKLPFGSLVIACGHSARDLYAELIAKGFAIEAKPFSAGVRIEHLQEELDRAMYGELAGKYGLVHADYAVSYRRGDRGVYSFCMCPGGEVVAAASEEGGVVTNGMSHYARDGRNANAALAVSVHPADYGADPTRAIAFQRTLEAAAFRAGGKTYKAPCQTVGDFLSGKHGTAPSRILPSYRGGDVVLCDLHDVLPSFITSLLADGLRSFGQKIRGFDAPDVPMTGVETRTSAPVRLLRGENCTALGHDRIYPCGEGAGYAGGIMSAAVDGIRVAQTILARYKRPDDMGGN